MRTQEKKYFAFISYQRKDEKWAKWLAFKLEHYHLPATLNGRDDLPKDLRPVFRDIDELSSGNLPKQIHQALLNSQNLIVICSPNSAQKDQWVNKEITDFIEMGRTNRIFPFIIKGKCPKEFFPSALLALPEDQECLGANVHDNGRSFAFVKLVAGMLDLLFDDLWQKHLRRQRKIKVAISICVFLLCLLLFLTWIYLRPTYRYFADYVDKWGVPTGIIELTKEQQRHRHRMYQFEYHRIPFGEPNAFWHKRISAVRYINSARMPQEMDEAMSKSRHSIQKIEYNKQTGDVSRIIFCNAKGKVILRHVLSDRDGAKACVADFIAPREQSGLGFENAHLDGEESIQTGRYSNIARFVYKRDDNGYIIHQTYHANNDYNLSRSAVADADGIFGRTYTLDSLGRVIKEDYVGLYGEILSTNRSVSGKRYEYDKYGNISLEEYLDPQGNLVLKDNNLLRWAKETTVANECGNVVEKYFFDAENRLLQYTSNVITYQYDDEGNIVEKSELHKDAAPDWHYSETHTKYKYDKQGNPVEEEYFDSEGKPCINTYTSCAKIIRKYDTHGNIIKEEKFDIDGKPHLICSTHAKTIYKYDDRCNKIEVAYLDTHEQLCADNDGVAKITYQYDNRGNMTEKAYWGIEGEPVAHLGNYSKVTYKYDYRGNMTEEAFWDTNGNLCLDGFVGYAKLLLKYDDQGNVIEDMWIGSDNKPCVVGGRCKCTYKYNSRGNLIEQIHYDIDGETYAEMNGVAKTIYEYNERGELVKTRCFNKNGDIVSTK